jgi:hypothetical protein
MRLSAIVAALLLVGASAFRSPSLLPAKRALAHGSSCRSSGSRQVHLMSTEDPSSDQDSDKVQLRSRRLLAKTIGLFPLGLVLGVAVPAAFSQFRKEDMQLVCFPVRPCDNKNLLQTWSYLAKQHSVEIHACPHDIWSPQFADDLGFGIAQRVFTKNMCGIVVCPRKPFVRFFICLFS